MQYSFFSQARELNPKWSHVSFFCGVSSPLSMSPIKRSAISLRRIFMLNRFFVWFRFVSFLLISFRFFMFRSVSSRFGSIPDPARFHTARFDSFGSVRFGSVRFGPVGFVSGRVGPIRLRWFWFGSVPGDGSSEAKGYLARVEAACLLEAAISCSPYNHHMKILAIDVYRQLGSFARGISLFNDLDVKQIQVSRAHKCIKYFFCVDLQFITSDVPFPSTLLLKWKRLNLTRSTR